MAAETKARKTRKTMWERQRQARIGVRNGFKSVYYRHRKKELAECVKRTLGMNPAFVENYAYTVGRNFAIQQMRARNRAVAREKAQALEAEREARYRADLVKAREEFWAILQLLKPEMTRMRIFQCHVLYWRTLRGWTDKHVAELWPTEHRWQRDNWVRRGREEIQPLASPNLIRFIKGVRPSVQKLHREVA